MGTSAGAQYWAGSGALTHRPRASRMFVDVLLSMASVRQGQAGTELCFGNGQGIGPDGPCTFAHVGQGPIAGHSLVGHDATCGVEQGSAMYPGWEALYHDVPIAHPGPAHGHGRTGPILIHPCKDSVRAKTSDEPIDQGAHSRV